MPDIKTDDYEFVCIPYDSPMECKVYKKFHLDKPIGRIVVLKDGTCDVYNPNLLPHPIVKQALSYLGLEKI